MNTPKQTPPAAATLVAAAAALLIGGAAGCASKLETGYEPRTLGSSSEVRRGYYAEPFTPEAKKARDYEADFGAANTGSARSRPGY